MAVMENTNPTRRLAHLGYIIRGVRTDHPFDRPGMSRQSLINAVLIAGLVVTLLVTAYLMGGK